jgi:hypothetical protein
MIHARAFLDRAKVHLAQFDQEQTPANLFYAALELRFGIEARLNDYLSPVLKDLGKDQKYETEYAGTKLLKKLLRLDPNADKATQLRFTIEATGSQTHLEFTPVSSRLAALHGQLGDCLHFKFFTANEHWYLKPRVNGISGKTLWTVRDLLEETVNELTEATRGHLTAHPRFTGFVQDALQEPETGQPGV